MNARSAPLPRSGTSNRLPADYSDSLGTFRFLARSAGARLASYPLRTHQENQAPVRHELDHASLTTDTAWLGTPAARQLVIIASGTHGVEGYAGAACQFHFLRHYHTRFARPSIAFLLVHAVNPWGFRHDRRVTHEGIDLNRNFLASFDQAPANPGYAAFHDLLVTQYRPLPWGAPNRLDVLRRILLPSTRRRLQCAVTAGQYDFPDGLFYGGRQPTESRLIWEKLVAEAAQIHPDMVLVDLHTGLGAYGRGELMSHLPSSSLEFQSTNRWFGGQLRSMADGTSVSPALQGMLTAAFVQSSPTTRHAFGLEFGTRSPLTVLAALRADQWSWLRRHAAPPRYREQARRAMRRAFAPADPYWTDRVTQRFDEVIQQLTSGLLQSGGIPAC